MKFIALQCIELSNGNVHKTYRNYSVKLHGKKMGGISPLLTPIKWGGKCEGKACYKTV